MDRYEVEFLCGCKAGGDYGYMSCPMHGTPEVHQTIVLLESCLSDYGFTHERLKYHQAFKVYYTKGKGVTFARIFLKHGTNSVVQLRLAGRSQFHEFDIHDPDSLDAIISKLTP